MGTRLEMTGGPRIQLGNLFFVRVKSRCLLETDVTLFFELVDLTEKGFPLL